MRGANANVVLWMAICAVIAGCSSSADDSMADAAQADETAEAPEPLQPIDPPVADDCITDVSAGDHTFVCQDHTFLVMVDKQCTHKACGLIFDVHGAAMSGEIMREQTHLHELAPPKGYLVVHPTAPNSTWDWEVDPPVLVDFMDRMIAAFHVDEHRVHVTGFSMGSAMTFWFLCNHRDVLASTGPVTGASAEQVTDMASGNPCIGTIDGDWAPRVPILFMSGRQDTALTIDAARERANGIVTRLDLKGGDEIDSDDSFSRKRWTGEGGMVFDFVEHDYASATLAGHCIPGGSTDGNIFACDNGSDGLQWGEVVLQWFIDQPKP